MHGLNQYDYHARRLTQTQHNLESFSTTMDNTYDELGRLTSVTPNNNASLKTTYQYNVRSWLTSLQQWHFGETLKYTYGGNINFQKLNTGENYTFSYDKLSRLIAGYHSGGAVNREVMYTYDKQGNILNLFRRGESGAYDGVESITATYSGNKLVKATNRRTSNSSMPYEFKDYADGDLNYNMEYAYNTNGSMTKDLNKGISSIQYNILNLPERMDIKSPIAEGRNEYLYDARGNKLRLIQRWNPNYSSYPVIGSDIRESSLKQKKWTQYMHNAEVGNNGSYVYNDFGYYQSNPGWVCYLYVKDHLGNIRAVMDKNGNLVQKTDYYPFGMPTKSSTNMSAQSRKYNGKEFDTMHGLNQYDYHARHYDPSIGRFTTIDPLAEKYYDISPYAYCMNNPMRYIDPWGCDTLDFAHDGRIAGIRLGGNDVLNVTNKKGKVVSKSYEAGTFASYGDRKGDNGYAFISGNNEENSKSMFEFLADNTTVEWGNSTFQNKDGSMSHYVTNSHSDREENGLSDLTIQNNWYDRALIKHDHSHPDRYPYPSGTPDSHYTQSGDIPFARMKTDRAISNVQPIPQFRIYIPGKGYLRYTPFTTQKLQQMYLSNPYIFYQK